MILLLLFFLLLLSLLLLLLLFSSSSLLSLLLLLLQIAYEKPKKSGKAVCCFTHLREYICFVFFLSISKNLHYSNKQIQNN